MSKKKLRDDLEVMGNYTDALEAELESSHDEIVYATKKILALQQTIEKLSKHIEMLDRQLAQQDLYLTRKDEENNVLKRMYRDDLINGRIG